MIHRPTLLNDNAKDVDPVLLLVQIIPYFTRKINLKQCVIHLALLVKDCGEAIDLLYL